MILPKAGKLTLSVNQFGSLSNLQKEKFDGCIVDETCKKGLSTMTPRKIFASRCSTVVLSEAASSYSSQINENDWMLKTVE